MKLYKIYLVVILFVSQLALSQEKEKEQEKPKELKEVVIEKETKTFTIKNGNITVDVANSIYNSASNPLDLLAMLPKIQISPDKQTISIVGKGSPLLYVDNQRIELNDLNSIAIDDIKTIEILQNPSSKYEAEGRAVILITLKFSKKEGYKVTVSENVLFKKYFNNYSGITSNFKTGKLEFKANFNYNQQKVWESNGNDFSIPEYDIQSDYIVTAVTQRPQFIFGGGVFYKINEDDYLSLSFSKRNREDDFSVVTQTVNQNQNVTDYINTLSINDGRQNFTNSFLNYNHKIKSLDAVLFSGFQYSNFSQQLASEISNDFNDSGFELAQNRNQKFGIDVYSGRIDLEKKFKNEMKFEVGLLHLAAEADTDFEVTNFNPTNTSNSIYNYKEQNSAAYSQFSGSYKKLNFSLGLRAEKTLVKGRYDTDSNESVHKKYTNLFPKAQLEMVIDSSNTIALNYSKSISRPNFSSTSQVAIYINPFFVWSNNINLNPSIGDELTFTYQFKDKLLRLTYYRTRNPVFYGASYDNSQNLLTFTTTNFEKETDFAIEVTLPFTYKFWTTTNVLNLGQTKIEDKSAVVNASNPSFYCYTNHLFSLPKNLELSFTAWGYTRQKLGIFDRSGLITMDGAVTKTFFKQLNCTLSFNDIFRKMNFKDNFTINNVSAKGVYYTDSRAISLSVKYSFGSFKNSQFKEKSIDENSERIK